MCLYPVKKGKLILCKLCKHFRLLIAGAKFFFHVSYNFRNTLVAFMLIECFKKIQL